MGKRILVIGFLFLLALPSLLAHDDPTVDEGLKLKNRAASVMMVSGVISAALVAIAVGTQQYRNGHKRLLFLGIIIPIIFATIFAASTTIYLNQISATKGPVHWHADFEIWNCGEKIEVVDPKGFSNRVGTPVFHEHDDDRIHVEGVIIEPENAALGNFFNIVGGTLSDTQLKIPTDAGSVTVENGMDCQGNPGKVQVFVYKLINPQERGNWQYEQHKIEEYEEYILSPYSQVPPGDCIIIEFDQEKEKTDKICTTFAAAEEQGELHGR